VENAILRGKRVLLVEDESLVAMLVEDMLLDLGAEVDVAMRLPDAMKLAEGGQYHLAVLDVNLGGGQRSDEVADALKSRGIPFLFATGYGERGLAERHRRVTTLQKPYRAGDLWAAVKQALDRRGLEGAAPA
jgi:CheY-like chemotaxis protein